VGRPRAAHPCPFTSAQLRRTALLALACTTLTLSACGGSSSSGRPRSAGPTGGQGSSVQIQGFKYGPATARVKAGGTVVWTNADGAAHTATSDSRSFDTGGLERGASKRLSFSTPGTFAYHCDFHPFMHGTVVVTR